MLKVWYDKYRKGKDGSRHEGKLELITWDGTDDDGERLGWGAVLIEEAEEHKRLFETKYGGNLEKFYDFWPQVMGKPLPDGICPPTSQSRKGLKLRRGPDPRSFNPAQAAISSMMRGLFGMDEPSDDGGSGGGGSGGSGGGRGGSGSSGAKGKGKDKGKGKAAKGAASGTAAAAVPDPGPDAAEAARACYVCCSRERRGGGTLLKCAACKAVRYCSTECQAAHWPTHKAPCKGLQQQQQREQREQQQLGLQDLD
ncbi:hypothetical protein GPECTOR_26g559 [Gonium pectorale]|uniref:MYND-type domain-containing protein n=1 Tax=Gonium pectorale TaxID=33097 RepID=A0A150GFQ0_GONPE|nr:hypothetical protein GPECTOR_26g559 [Gonium pectorale]|eukprot:KXZ48656.1 hypothetical protein GPECTOR_26g559 [Gonium pectorale]